MKRGRIDSAIVCVFSRCVGNRGVFVWLGFLCVCEKNVREWGRGLKVHFVGLALVHRVLMLANAGQQNG